MLIFSLNNVKWFQIYGKNCQSSIFRRLTANGLQAGAEKLGGFKRVSQQRPVLKVKTLFVVCNTSCQP
jgi:hypothetical protein